MPDTVAVTMRWDLRRHLDAPEREVPTPTSRPSPALRPANVCLLTDLLTGLAILLPAIAPYGVSGFTAGPHGPGIGLLAAGLYLSLGVSQSRRYFPHMRRPAGHAALLAALAVIAVGTWWTLFEPARDISLAGLQAIGIWAAIAACSAALINILAFRAGGISMRIALVGDDDAVSSMSTALRHALAMQECRVVVGLRDRSLPDMALLASLVAGGSVDLVVLAMPADDPHRLSAVCHALADSQVHICLGLDPVAVGQARRAGRLGGIALVDLWRDPHAGAAQLAKRAMDLLGSAILLTMLAPLLLLLAALIRLETPGPVLFRQWRFGLGSKPFVCFKFRSMSNELGDPTGAARTQRHDPRVTRIGRFLRRSSLDELPQLINVLRGEMSLVGPRPHPMHMRVDGSYYFDAVPDYRLRHRMKPGITGWAQVNGSRGEVATLEQARNRVALDIEYVRSWSLAADLNILTRTLFRGFFTAAD